MMKFPRIDLSQLRSLSSLRSIPLHMSGRQRKFARWAGMGLLAIVSFLITLKFTFPYERMKGALISALSEKFDVTVGDVGGGFLPGTVVFEDLVLRSRPSAPGEKPSEIAVNELVLDLGLDFGLVGALRKKAVFDIEADLVGGEIEAEVEASPSMFEAHVETQALALGKLPGVAAAVGLPMSGSLDAEVDLRLPGGKWKNAEGRVEIDCVDCTVGDGVSKMTMAPSTSSSSGRRRRGSTGAAAYGATGVTVPRLTLGEAAVVVDISKGVGEIKTFSAASKDGWLKIEGKIEFRDPFANSLFPGCMRFKLSDELKQRERDFGNIEFTLSEKMRQEDGSYALPTKGRLTELRWDVRRKCGGGSTEEEGEGRRTPPERPGLAGRPSLDPSTPPQGGTPVDPAQVPGVSGAAGEQPPTETPPQDIVGQPDVQAPGTSGPALAPGSDNAPAQPAPAGDAGAGAAPPPPPPNEGDNGGNVETGGLRRLQPEEAPEAGDPPPPPPQDEGEQRPPEGEQPPLPPDQQPQQQSQPQTQPQQQSQPPSQSEPQPQPTERQPPSQTQPQPQVRNPRDQEDRAVE
ncbi:MAG TPA: type II secretion system protein GspN [Kofleriaceae bacterium]|nr:type II secretion system protein GspN [Kofleriaceae bacterium]